jgi:hypothetical protein
MNKLITALAFIAMLSLVPGISSAGQQASKTKTATGYSYTMCVAEDATGVCDGGTGTNPDLYAIVDKFTNVTFTLVDPLDSSAICEIYAATTADSALEGVDDITAYGGDKINSVDLSNDQEKIEYSNINYKYMWVKCTTNDADSTVIMQGSVGRER